MQTIIKNSNDTLQVDGNYSEGYVNGFQEGYSKGESKGYQDGFAQGIEEGYLEGKEEGINTLEFDEIFEIFDVDLYMVEKVFEHLKMKVICSPTEIEQLKSLITFYFPNLFQK